VVLPFLLTKKGFERKIGSWNSREQLEKIKGSKVFRITVILLTCLCRKKTIVLEKKMVDWGCSQGDIHQYHRGKKKLKKKKSLTYPMSGSSKAARRGGEGRNGGKRNPSNTVLSKH